MFDTHELNFLVQPSTYYDLREEGGGEGWSWPELTVTGKLDGKRIQTTKVPMYDTESGTVKLAMEKAVEYLTVGEGRT